MSSLVAGCDLPRDPEGTLAGARGGTLRAGIMHDPPWTIIGEDGSPKGGIEVALVAALAQELDARIEWHAAGETELMETLRKFKLDLVVGGLGESSAWKGKVALTEPYLHAPYDADASAVAPAVAHVFATPPGENAWLLWVEEFLSRARPEAELLLRRASAGKRTQEPGGVAHVAD